MLPLVMCGEFVWLITPKLSDMHLYIYKYIQYNYWDMPRSESPAHIANSDNLVVPGSCGEVCGPTMVDCSRPTPKKQESSPKTKTVEGCFFKINY